ncbi:MAG: OmpA family protein [Xenococcus sp. MO_188.B8]|nr:OmpA family protein [Xenococcus sp. MO_188.B8]
MSDKLPESLENLISLIAENMTDSQKTGDDFLQKNGQQEKPNKISIAQLAENLAAKAAKNLDRSENIATESNQEIQGRKLEDDKNKIEIATNKINKLEKIDAEFVEEDFSATENNSRQYSPAKNPPNHIQEKKSENIFTIKDFLQKPDNLEAALIKDWITKKERQIDDLATSMNSIIPLVVELLSIKTNDSREAILKAVVPIIDKIIDERSTQDNQSMAAVIAKILPSAISQEIRSQPQSIAKAIAPEVAFSIEEQIVIDEDAISRALGSEMGKAIKAQIALERDAMVDALYPVIGSTISKYMAEVVRSINEKVEETLSPKGISRKIRAKMQGVSEAELILREAISYSIRAIFLIDKASGLVIQEIQPLTENILDSDMVAGMLTAIRSFANDCIASGSELDEIDYGNFRIILETAGYCYVAVVVNGEPDQEFRDRIRQTFSQIVLKYGKQIENYNGDPETISPRIQSLLEKIIPSEDKRTSENKRPITLIWLVIVLLSSILIPWGMIQYRAKTAQRIEQKITIALDSNPQLSIYRLIPEVKRGKLSLAGKVPSNYYRELAAQVAVAISTTEKLQLDNQIIAVNTLPDPDLTAQEIARTTKIFNQQPQIAIATSYQNNTVTIDGFVLDASDQEIITSALAALPGVEQIIFLAQHQLPILETRIYFESGSLKFRSVEDSSKIDSVKQFLDQYPLLNLRIIGHSDRSGSKSINQKLGSQRAQIIYRQAIAQKVNPQRLQLVSSLELPPDIAPGDPLWLSRCVRFETFIP